MGYVDSVINWEFLNEPLKRWFLFFGALLAIMWAWSGVLGFVR